MPFFFKSLSNSLGLSYLMVYLKKKTQKKPPNTVAAIAIKHTLHYIFS